MGKYNPGGWFVCAKKTKYIKKKKRKESFHDFIVPGLTFFFFKHSKPVFTLNKKLAT